MTDKQCPVHQSILELEAALTTGRVSMPKSQRIIEEMVDLLRDIASGRAGGKHLPSLNELTRELAAEGNDSGAVACAKSIEAVLATQSEVFQSHVETHNCAAGQCVRLAPAPCQTACPAGIDVPTYVTLIGMGRDAEAIEVIRRDNPFPWVCGLVCTRPCEFMCVRGRIDTPISIKFLKAFAAERSLSEGRYRNPEPNPANGRKVCVVGAGPGGMSAAYYLALKGYRVRVIEALPVAGGMIMVGIPRYRLPREVIDREVAMLEALGVTFSYNTRLGSDVSMEELRKEGYEAFFLAIGAHKAFQMHIPGEDDFPMAFDAIDLLRQVALGDRRPPGHKIVVIGGGNVAIDAARTALRLGCEEVTVAYRRTRHEMPADEEEVEQAEEEGVHFAFLTVPQAVVGSGDRIDGLSCLRAELVKREGGNRMSPVPVEGSDHLIEADVVISAIGQRVDGDCLAELTELEWTRRETIHVNTATMETNIPGIFAAGDAVTGPATVIEAIGGGKKAAVAIDRFLNGIPQPTMPPVPKRRMRAAMLEVPASTKMVIKRPEMPMLNIDRRRTTFQQAELGYSENMVREESRRCLRCDVCLRCGKCVEVCRDKMGIDALQMGHFDFDHPGGTDFRLTEERCITCGACAANCPNDAMKMEDREGERILSICGTILNRQKLVTCSACGAVMGPVKYLEYIRKKTDRVAAKTSDQVLCDACLRKSTARFHVETTPV